MYQGTLNALLIAAGGILFALAAWQRPRLERAVYAVAGQTLRAANWVASIVRRHARHAGAMHLWAHRAGQIKAPLRKPKKPPKPLQPCALHPDKKQHATREEAVGHIAELYRRGLGNTDYNAYRCKDCRGWHVGHSLTHFQARIKLAIRGGRDE
jgi:hypothetical protein